MTGFFFICIYRKRLIMVSYNIKFPLEDNPSKNRFFQMTNTTKEALASNLMLLLLTEKGERYYMPDYGTNLLQFLFEPNDSLTINDIKEDIKRTVSKYIPELNIDDIEFKQDTDFEGNPINENALTVLIKFTYSENTFVDTGEIELNF